ncbi:hypothetical protein GCM10009844_00690 [Nocardioides koreensis]|uniref:Uncharacterized protein n=1 Tax=Nocardioides koreensis TaxID=433651 RepID=A0ABP5KSH7_9ACTN
MFAVHPFLFDRDPTEKDSDQATGHAVEDEVSEGGGPAEETRGACDVDTPREPPGIEVPPNE